jgi:hypothetical protein
MYTQVHARDETALRDTRFDHVCDDDDGVDGVS